MAERTRSRPYLTRGVVEFLMFGSGHVRRFTQDSPVLPDVWLEYALAPEELPHSLARRRDPGGDPHPPVELILTPYREVPTGTVRTAVLQRVRAERQSPTAKSFLHEDARLPRVIYNQSTVSARVYFEELVRAVIPLTDWWQRLTKRFDPATLQDRAMQDKLAFAVQDPEHRRGPSPLPLVPPDVLWLIRVVGAIALAHRGSPLPAFLTREGQIQSETKASDWLPLVRAVADLMRGVGASKATPRVHSIALNRVATPTIFGSRLAVKADAAQRVFEISCKEIGWAILDSGIDATHPAFRKPKDEPKPGRGRSRPARGAERPFADYDSRVCATYDFSQLHLLLDPDSSEQPARIEKLRKIPARKKEIEARLRDLNDALSNGRSVDWGLIAPLLKIEHDGGYAEHVPQLDHGTHVAGILGASWKDRGADEDDLVGICPDIGLYDLRVLDENGNGDEFTVMAALQFVRWLNSTNDYMAVHGVNMSLSIPHDVANYACGRTPVCEEAERVITSGIVVVAAAGNLGYRKYASTDGVPLDAYNTISITDPGNAHLVITVGSTHRVRPHTYGVSYFSSRGPTGDGRAKPDLVAPGEKITSAIPGGLFAVKDGTSMAAPHVSGAAALLMARHNEFVGRPARIKEILCETATDLGRERYFQGAGMLDILRALQSV